MLLSGAIVHDRYRITRAIGRGGMGAVYEAVDSPVRVAFDYGLTYLAGGGTRARVTADAAGVAPTGVFSMTLGAGQARSHWVEFEVTGGRARSFDVVLAAPSGEPDVVRFPPFTVAVADRSR